ncbi:hypothetical protein QJ857_gp0949 [Tupanvirus soda lake]|uniref:Uncharacterized protein n=2 Tax=Tupanvirus TaxID=2094720 RepID=A0A6N1NKE7_9VIRU|nr:hypothetical protein QJ857_gp0949 [Tupanvirus soda lake]QKU35105.1 hypothetical protein [Tupanvirus soda lake]
MNNNYHTQMDKQNNNMLNEIAASNHLLQQQMQNFQGTPINKSQQPNQQINAMAMNPATMNPAAINPATMNPATMNPAAMNPATMNPQLMQQLYAQQMAQQAQQNQLYQQQQQKLNNQTNQQFPQQQPIADDDEIELSDTKPEPKQKASTQDTKQPQQINKQIQQLIQNNDEQPDPTAQQLAQKIDKNAIQAKKPNTQIQYPPQIKYVPVEKPQSKMMEYIVIPILLIVVFVALVHPKTSSILEKYLPQLTSTKGILIRGAVLAVLYIVIRFIASSMSKK